MEELENTSSLFNSSPKNQGIDPPKKSIFNSQAVLPISNTTKFSGQVEGYNLGIGDSKYDKGLTWSTDIDPTNIENSINEYRAQNEPWRAKAAAGVGRILTKAVAEVVKLPGVALGLAAAPFAEENEGWQTAFNNDWIKAVNHINENINKEYLPVYVKESVKNGDIIDNLSSIDFWATEGADGMGFIVSMLAPGAALKALNAGDAILGTTAKGLSLINGQRKLAGATQTLSDLGITANSVELGTQTLANTLFEAGSEAGSAMENFDGNKQSYIEKRSLEEFSKLDKQYRKGNLTLEEYNNLLSLVPEQIDKEFQQQKGRLGRDIFWSNTAILIGPNAIMSKMLWGKTGKKFIQETNPTLKNTIGKGLKRTGEAFVSEGLWEEGLQSTVENMFTTSAKKGELSSNVLGDFNGNELISNYLDTVTSTNGQKAIALGGLLGGGITSVSGYKNDIADIKNTNSLINLAKEEVNNFNIIQDTDPYQRDENNEIIFDSNNNPIYDPVKVNTISKALKLTEEQSNLFDEAIAKGDTELLDTLKDNAINQLIIPFINKGEAGIGALKQYLEESNKDPQLQSDPKSQDYIDNIVNKATSLSESYQIFKDYHQRLTNLSNNEALPEDYINFYNNLANKYLSLKGREFTLNQKLDILAKDKNKILSTLKGKEKIKTNEILDPDATEDIFKYKYVDNPLVSEINIQIQKVNDELKNIDKIVNEDIWDSNKVNELFDYEVKSNNKIRKDNSVENIQKTDEELQQVKEAFTIDELDSVVTNNPAVKAEITAKKQQLQEIKNVQDVNSKVDNQDNKKRIQSELQDINDNYNTGDEFPGIEGLGLSPKLQNEKLIISSKTDNIITLATEDGKYKQTFKIDIPIKPIHQFDTEGTGEQVTNQNPSNPKDYTKIGVEVVSTDNQNDFQALPFMDRYFKGFVEFERNPLIKKIGKEVSFEINTKAVNDPQWERAIELYNNISNLSEEDINFLIDYLPINVVFNENTKAPIHTYYNSVKNTFGNTTRNLRETIIRELVNGTNINSIKTVVQGQYNGQIVLEENIVENNISNLYEFGNDPNNLKSSMFYVVDDFGVLKNHEDDILPANRLLAPGEVYLKIHTANGSDFPLKLNVRKLSTQQAEVLYEMFKYRFEDFENRSSTDLFRQIDNPALKELIQLNLQEELKVIDKKLDDLTIKDITDFLIFSNSESPKSRLRFDNTRQGLRLTVFDKQYDLEQLSNSKEDFIREVTSNKRQNIRHKYNQDRTLPNINITNRKYLDYLINSSILNTNAKVDGPTFRGYTGIFLDMYNIKVNGELSNFNPLTVKKVEPIKQSGESLVGVKIEGPTFDFTQLGMELPTKTIEEVKKDIPKTVNVYKGNVSLINEATSQLARDQGVYHTFNESKYFITYGVNQTDNNGTGFHVFNIDNNRPILINNYEEALKIINDYNSKTKSPLLKLNENNFNKIWNSRLNSISLSDKVIKPQIVEQNVEKKSDMIDFNKVSEQQAKNFLKQVMLTLPGRFNKEIIAGAKTPINTFESIYKQIEESNELKNTLEDLRKKCNL